MSQAERLMLVLNEDPAGSHVDIHFALDEMTSSGLLADSCVVPFRALLRQGASMEALGEEIARIAERFCPTQVIFSHTAGVRIEGGILEAVRRSSNVAPALGYWEADWYARLSKPFPSEVGALCSECDVAFVCGEGYVSEALFQSGCPRIEYVPLVADERFAIQPGTQGSWDFDLVMVGNLHSRRNPLRMMRGAAERKRLVDMFSERLGKRFAVFGAGWTGASAMGVIPFSEQAEVYRRSAAVLGNNDLHAGYYFSNRLPIAMMASRPVIHRFERGLDVVIPAGLSVEWFTSLGGAWDCFRRLADTSFHHPGLDRACSYASSNLCTRRALTFMSEVLGEARRSLAGEPVGHHVANPWGVQLGRRCRP